MKCAKMKCCKIPNDMDTTEMTVLRGILSFAFLCICNTVSFEIYANLKYTTTNNLFEIAASKGRLYQ